MADLNEIVIDSIDALEEKIGLESVIEHKIPANESLTYDERLLPEVIKNFSGVCEGLVVSNSSSAKLAWRNIKSVVGAPSGTTVKKYFRNLLSCRIKGEGPPSITAQLAEVEARRIDFVRDFERCELRFALDVAAFCKKNNRKNATVELMEKLLEQATGKNPFLDWARNGDIKERYQFVSHVSKLLGLLALQKKQKKRGTKYGAAYILMNSLLGRRVKFQPKDYENDDDFTNEWLTVMKERASRAFQKGIEDNANMERTEQEVVSIDEDRLLEISEASNEAPVNDERNERNESLPMLATTEFVKATLDEKSFAKAPSADRSDLLLLKPDDSISTHSTVVAGCAHGSRKRGRVSTPHRSSNDIDSNLNQEVVVKPFLSSSMEFAKRSPKIEVPEIPIVLIPAPLSTLQWPPNEKNSPHKTTTELFDAERQIRKMEPNEHEHKPSSGTAVPLSAASQSYALPNGKQSEASPAVDSEYQQERFERQLRVLKLCLELKVRPEPWVLEGLEDDAGNPLVG